VGAKALISLHAVRAADAAVAPAFAHEYTILLYGIKHLVQQKMRHKLL
jgi:hypothetical protein